MNAQARWWRSPGRRPSCCGTGCRARAGTALGSPRACCAAPCPPAQGTWRRALVTHNHWQNTDFVASGVAARLPSAPPARVESVGLRVSAHKDCPRDCAVMYRIEYGARRADLEQEGDAVPPCVVDEHRDRAESGAQAAAHWHRHFSGGWCRTVRQAGGHRNGLATSR